MQKKRAAFYFDGFNLYHALNALRQEHLKWLSLHGLGDLLIPSRDEEVRSVVYFSAYLTHKPQKLVRHRAYVAALEATGVECVLGRFKYSNVRCRTCGSQWRSYEEKETDVNIGIRIVRDAFRDVFDVYYLVSADTDLAPAIRLLKREFPQKEFVSVATPRRPHSSEFLRLADRTLKITENALAKCLLPAGLAGKDGKVIVRPPQYDPPKGASR
jgi:uncharacterized LabA/DUF88 family protein